MPVTHERTFIFKPIVIEYVGDQIDTDKIKGHSKAVHDLVVGDHVSVSDLTILEIRNEEALDPADMIPPVPNFSGR
jgi:hypothetical protein